MEEVGRGVDVSVRKVSPPWQLIEKGRHFSSDYIVDFALVYKCRT
jgi:hypothetical protein